ncbi:MAG: hypothetical protein KC800_32650 [Candidatus Eremiobacteraeota bacterium]|nr:hypothetical protein [Candidatus Eremiobacteraeota bacterium]
MRYTLFLIFVMMLVPAGAQSQDLAGVWGFTDKHGTARKIELSSQGNSWVGKSLTKQAADLKLNPAGLRNQWMGDFKLDKAHSVKADYKSGSLVLTDLDNGETWTLTRD